MPPAFYTITIVMKKLLAALLLLSFTDLSAAAVNTGHAKASLVADATQSDEFLYVGLKLDMDPGWHTYWKNPGDSGGPFSIMWSHQMDIIIEDVSWPTPEIIPYDPLITYGYKDFVIFPFKVFKQPDSELGLLSAELEFLICSDICIPESAELSIDLSQLNQSSELLDAVNELPNLVLPIGVQASLENIVIEFEHYKKPTKAYFFSETEDVVEELEMKALDGESNSDLEEGEMVELDLDALKEELEEAAKPDFLDLDKDGDKEEPMKKAAKEAEETNEAVDVEDPEQPLDSDEINPVSEEIEITEENIAAAIEEILKVDYETVPRGDLGTTHPTKAQQEYAVDATLAKNESDDDEGDVYNPPLNVKELEENIKKLQEELDSVNLEKNKINEEYKNLKKVSMKAANKLEELNLSNAKLLYQNRILESDSLNERQKQRLVEKVSNAESINEAKIIFDTLNEELEARKDRAPKNLSEVTSKNSQLILKSNKPAKSSVQEQVSNRMKKLAGLI